MSAAQNYDSFEAQSAGSKVSGLRRLRAQGLEINDRTTEAFEKEGASMVILRFEAGLRALFGFVVWVSTPRHQEGR